MLCIFCAGDSTDSRSVEHIMPESIGSKKRVLPRGVVCDKCNNYFARKVEQPILNHPWMRNIRAWQQIPNKRGSYQSLLGHIAGTEIAVNMRRSKSGSLQLDTENKNDQKILQRVIAEKFERPLIFTIEDNPPKKEMSRFLCKMAYETFAELFCKNPQDTATLIHEPFLNNIRRYARYGDNFKEWPFSQRRIFPHDTLMRHPIKNEWVHAGFGCGLFMNKRRETLFGFIFYGVEFVINIGGPSIEGYREWLSDHAGISPMVERLGCYLEHSEDGKYYLHGEFNASNGLEFDKKHGYAPYK
ncbi:hypothetical protein IMQ31_18355 [Escherichia coli O169:H41]|uniref:HNH endonuclease n=1 Tax=Escherichia coli TaxID=562 RepID=UPI0017A3B3C1|nr:HNH endonuclease [Escherichia coli]EFF1836399.1 HNH endonuclease [Escherichia coli]EJB6368402.1 hypothetical protein [Escherichia coli]QPE20956.1 hypothetical protein IMQ31_18355 [Escherichia coli O167:H26]HBA5689289.1 HNH endonuclease [Escherichia coli]HBA5745228.1 HNH endonuclease [Escherichia coli]